MWIFEKNIWAQHVSKDYFFSNVVFLETVPSTVTCEAMTENVETSSVPTTIPSIKNETIPCISENENSNSHVTTSHISPEDITEQLDVLMEPIPKRPKQD